MSRARSVVLPALLVIGAFGCDRDPETVYVDGYCDDSGCYGCSGSRDWCWPLPHDPCAKTSDCKPGQVCTNVGCADACADDTGCRAGERCTEGKYCAPRGADVKPVADGPATNNPGGTNNPATKVCLADAECGAGKVCNAGACAIACTSNAQCEVGLSCVSGKCRPSNGPVCGVAAALCSTNGDCGGTRICQGGTCHAVCTTTCPIGQACRAGVCVDQAPGTAQCLWDADCGGASRCINAVCHPLCANGSQCGAGELCDSGVCRADYRPAR